MHQEGFSTKADRCLLGKSNSAAAHRLATLVDDWSPLRQLTAFRKLERDTISTLEALGARTGSHPLL